MPLKLHMDMDVYLQNHYKINSMKKCLLSAVVFCLSFNPAFCQLPYTLTILQETYQPLIGGTSINNGVSWTDTNSYSVPIGFNFTIEDKTTSSFNLSCRGSFMTDTPGRYNSFTFSGAALTDRSYGGAQSLSPIRYNVNGVAGSRIFKAEFFNAGFNSTCQPGQLNDSTNMQVWLYETSNIVEFHYGASYTPDSSCYFTSLGPLINYFSNDSSSSGTPHHFSGALAYFISGNPSNPTFYEADSAVTGLSGYPANGTVYRFTPVTTGISKINSVSAIKVYPNPATDLIRIENANGSSLIILNTLGQKVYQRLVNQDKESILIQNFANGIYFLQITNKEGVKVLRTIVKE